MAPIMLPVPAPMPTPPNQRHGRSFEGSITSGVITLTVILVSRLLALCAVWALARQRPGLMLESLGMATMLLVMRLMH